MKCCVSTDVGTWTSWLIFEPDLYHSPDAGTGLLSPIAYALQRGILLRREKSVLGARRYCDAWFWVVCTAVWNFITSGKSHILVLGTCRSSDAWFWGVETPLLEVNGGQCALPSALLVEMFFHLLRSKCNNIYVYTFGIWGKDDCHIIFVIEFICQYVAWYSIVSNLFLQSATTNSWFI